MAENPVARIRHNLVSLRMPRALEALEAIIQQIERGQLGALEAIDTLLAEEITVREGRRIKAALQMARLATVKTLTGFDFSFQPSLDRNRIMALASLEFIERHEVVHFIGQSGTGKSHLAIALGVEAIRAGRSVYFCSLADIIDSLAKADREGRLRERIRYLCRTQLLIIDEIGYVTLGAAAGNLFFQLTQRSLRARRHDPDLQSRLCRMGPSVRRSRHRHGPVGSAAAPRRGRAHRGLQLPHAPACRPAASDPATCLPPGRIAQTARSAAEGGGRYNGGRVASTNTATKWGNFVRHFWGEFSRR